MPHDIRVIHSQEFLRTDAQGHYDLEATRRLFLDAVWACKHSHIGRILIDVRDATADLTAAQVCSLAGACRELGTSSRDRIAILNRPKDGLDRAALVSEVAQAQGWNVAAFRDFEKAFEWLAQPEAEPVPWPQGAPPV